MKKKLFGQLEAQIGFSDARYFKFEGQASTHCRKLPFYSQN